MSATARREELVWFSLPPTNSGVENMHWIEYYPISKEPIEFNITGNSIQYVGLFRTKLHVKAKIEESTGESISQDDKVLVFELTYTRAVVTDECLFATASNQYWYGLQLSHQSLYRVALRVGSDVKESRLTFSIMLASLTSKLQIHS